MRLDVAGQHIRSKNFRSFDPGSVIKGRMKDATLFSLALSLLPGVGRRQLYRLASSSTDLQRIFQMGNGELRRLGLKAPARQALLGRQILGEAERMAAAARSDGIGVLSFFDAGYPHRLREIHDPPLVLYYRGRTELLETPSIALVGSRSCSVYGAQVSCALARELAQLGLTIVSGLARGIDSQAHRGALEANGATIAVLGNGVDVIYPRENRKFYREVAEKGCLISEFPCQSYPAPQNFPIRNRIISGLSLGVVIGEAAEFSGSLITARLALEQDRELWAVPGPITQKGSYGPNYLIKQGARIVLSAQDVLDELPLEILTQLDSQESSEAHRDSEQEEASVPLKAGEKQVLDCLPVDTCIHIDDLRLRCRLSWQELNRCLLDLELKRLILQRPGRNYCRRLKS